MGNRRFVPSSDDEDNSPPARNSNGDVNRSQRKRKKVHLPDEEEEDDDRDIGEVKLSEQTEKKKKKRDEPEPDPEPGSENEEPEDLEALPVGGVVRVSGKGRGRRSHYASFEYDGLQYDLEDPVLLVPENGNQKPYIAIVKDIAKTREGALMVTGQWFYRPEEAEKKGGGNWQSSDTRELFYSFHRDEVPAESVMHKCVIHFIPQDKQIPHRKQHPGFIVQKVYDTDERRLFKLTDKDYEDNKQHEIDLLVQKTVARIGDLPDLEPEGATVEHEDELKSKRLIRKRKVSPLDVTRVDGELSIPQSLKAQTPGSACETSSEYSLILSNLKLLTGETQRDKRLEKLFESIQCVCTADGKQKDERQQNGNKISSSDDKSHDKADTSADWPNTAAHAVAALEKAAHEAFSADFQKYNQKMRQLAFNLKSNGVLARRLLNKELEPAQILNMSPNELKEGLTAEEIVSRQPEEPGHIQMTDARCSRCSLKQVALVEVFQTGHGDRYKLECVPCGYSWFASGYDAATLTIEAPSSAKAVGTAPLATAKFENVEKNLVSPRGGESERETKQPLD
ncbi:bromo-adjacent homology (BAH) domain-containing protein [Striga hermonthica]|uniref:Bromo-adjacent homology (BAH) domain-containing protein n=1 Tax=Striga hermonthica TaxID=68872 RepID=A0A9N7N0Y9_STRHE|nr:bromo-adjacent homology (BAH) domain-containing protein [Striga hermonthica]